MTLIASTSTAIEAGHKQGALASYDDTSNTATFYKEFFEINSIIQAATVFHEYIHSFPENIALVKAADKDEMGIPHRLRTFEVEPVRLEGIFRERFRDQLAKELGVR